MKKKLINVAKYALGLLLGGAFLYLAFQGADWEEILQALRNINPGWIVASLAVLLFSHFLRGVRWRMQLKPIGYQPSYLNLFATVLLTYLVNLALPRAGELARCTSLLRTDKVPLARSFGTVVVERILDLLIMLTLIFAVFVMEADTLFEYLSNQLTEKSDSQSPALLLSVLAAIGVIGLVGIWLLRHRLLQIPLVQKLVKFTRELWQAALSIRYVERPGLFIFYSVAIFAGYWLTNYLCFFAIDDFWQLDRNLLYLSLVSTVMGGIGFIIPAPGGTGPYHAAVTFTFVALMVTGEEESSRQLGQTYAIISHSSQVLLYVVFGIISYVFLMIKKPTDSALEPTATASNP